MGMVGLFLVGESYLYLVFIAWRRKHGVDLKMIIGALCVRKL